MNATRTPPSASVRAAMTDLTAHYHRTCHLPSQSPWFGAGPAIVVPFPRHHALYRPLLKAASKSVEAAGLSLDGSVNEEIAIDSCPMARGHFSGWLNFTLVREPLERFVSSYNFLMGDAHFEREICGLVQRLLPAAAASLSCPRRSQRVVHNVSEFAAYVSVVEQLGWVNVHIVPQAMQLSRMDGRPDATLREVRMLAGSSSDAVKVQVRGLLARNGSVDARRSALGAGTTSRVHATPKGAHSVGDFDALPSDLLVRACRLVLVDYCCFGVPLPPVCERGGLSCRATASGLLELPSGKFGLEDARPSWRRTMLRNPNIPKCLDDSKRATPLCSSVCLGASGAGPR